MTSALPILILVWLTTGFSSVVVSILGNAFGKTGLFTGAFLGGALGAVVAVFLTVRLGWLPKTSARAASIGAVIGFALAIPVILTHMHTPVIPVMSCALAGVGALVGAGVRRGWASR